MFGVILYIGACFIASAVATFFWVVTRSIQSRDEMRSWRIFSFLFAFSLVIPYALFEVATSKYGPELKKAAEHAYDDSEVGGEYLYHKVLYISATRAKVIVVGKADLVWGGTERPVVKVNMVREKNKWKADSYDVLLSDSLNKDHVVFPPFF